MRCRIQRRKESMLNSFTYIYYSSAGNGSGLLQAEGRCEDKYCLYLDDKARETVSLAVNTFEAKTEAARTWPSFEFEFSGLVFTLFYWYIGADLFDFMLDVKAGEEILTLYESRRVGDPIKMISELAGESEYGKTSEDIRASEKALPDVLYEAACGTGDRERGTGDSPLALLIKHHYRHTGESDIPELERLFGGKVLPPLSNEFDRYFTVNTATIDFEMLRCSGYQFLHRPYFAMRGCTRQKCKLNPARRFGVDFGENDETAIDFDEYLKLFVQNSIDAKGQMNVQ